MTADLQIHDGIVPSFRVQALYYKGSVMTALCRHFADNFVFLLQYLKSHRHYGDVMPSFSFKPLLNKATPMTA